MGGGRRSHSIELLTSAERRHGCLSGVLGVFVLLTVALTTILVQTLNRDKKEAASGTHYALALIQGNGPEGVVHMVAKGTRVHIRAELTGLAPQSEHGFHIYEFADETAAESDQIGSIFSHVASPHGCPGQSQRRTGDLGNVVADARGRAVYDRVDDLVRLTGSHSVVGRSIVIQSDGDDCRAQPNGNAGEAIAHGMILVGNPTTIPEDMRSAATATPTPASSGWHQPAAAAPRNDPPPRPAEERATPTPTPEPEPEPEPTPEPPTATPTTKPTPPPAADWTAATDIFGNGGGRGGGGYGGDGYGGDSYGDVGDDRAAPVLSNFMGGNAAKTGNDGLTGMFDKLTSAMGLNTNANNEKRKRKHGKHRRNRDRTDDDEAKPDLAQPGGLPAVFDAPLGGDEGGAYGRGAGGAGRAEDDDRIGNGPAGGDGATSWLGEEPQQNIHTHASTYEKPSAAAEEEGQAAADPAAALEGPQPQRDGSPEEDRQAEADRQADEDAVAAAAAAEPAAEPEPEPEPEPADGAGKGGRPLRPEAPEGAEEDGTGEKHDEAAAAAAVAAAAAAASAGEEEELVPPPEGAGLPRSSLSAADDDYDGDQPADDPGRPLSDDQGPTLDDDHRDADGRQLGAAADGGEEGADGLSGSDEPDGLGELEAGDAAEGAMGDSLSESGPGALDSELDEQVLLARPPVVGRMGGIPAIGLSLDAMRPQQQWVLPQMGGGAADALTPNGLLLRKRPVMVRQL